MGLRRDPDAIGLHEQGQCGRDYEGGGNDADGLDDLLLVGGGSHQVSGLEILEVVTGHGSGTTDNRADQNRRGRTDRAVRSQEYQEKQG